jgi:hypothetical protein
MKKKLLVVSMLLILASTISAATISLTDDDPIQYIKISQTQAPPTGSTLHLYVKGSGTTYADAGIPVLATDIKITKGTTTTMTGPSLVINYNTDYWLYTRYEMFQSDLNTTIFGANSDTVHISVVVPVMPPGEAITITLDK